MKFLYKERLKELREEKDLKQYKLAEILEFGNNSYGQFEREETILPIKHLNTLCNYFDVSIDYIFNFTNTKQYKKVSYEIDKKLAGERLKEFRKENKLTQINLAQKFGVDKSTISKYEKGIYVIATPFIYNLCKEFHVSADYLLGRVNEPKYLN